MKIPLNCVWSGKQFGSQTSCTMWFESVRLAIAALARTLAESMIDWSGDALLSSTSPPRMTPSLYDQTVRNPVLVQLYSSPSLMRLSSLMSPEDWNHVHWS